MKGLFHIDPVSLWVCDANDFLVTEVPEERRQYVLDALNEKWERENRCRAKWRAGVLSGPGSIPDGARCLLAPHGPDVEHVFRKGPERGSQIFSEDPSE